MGRLDCDRMFVAVLENRSFAKAAKQLGARLASGARG
jgi:DNA-binding transcriptional LysR family regulator